MDMAMKRKAIKKLNLNTSFSRPLLLKDELPRLLDLPKPVPLA
jgi:hypothetical protein